MDFDEVSMQIELQCEQLPTDIEQLVMNSKKSVILPEQTNKTVPYENKTVIRTNLRQPKIIQKQKSSEKHSKSHKRKKSTKTTSTHNSLKPINKSVTKINKAKDHLYTFIDPSLKIVFEQVLKIVPGRRQEAVKVFDFIIKSQKGSSTPICLHGNTGCGKTSLIEKVLTFCQHNLHNISTSYLNCMSMWSTNRVYGAILRSLFGQAKHPKSEIVLNELFRQTRIPKNHKLSQNTKIIVLDQIDQFINDQSFLYNLLEWVHLPGSKIILILISNVIDLNLKLQGKLQSRMKFQTIIFKPYTFQQVRQIIQYKFPSIQDIFQYQAILYLCKKIANISSDIRLLELVYMKIKKQCINKATIQDVQNCLYNTGDIQVAQLLSSYQILMKILHYAPMSSDIAQEVINKYFLNNHKLTSQDVLLALAELQDYGLITILNTHKNADLCFQHYGIKIHECLHLMCPEDDLNI